MRPAMGTPLWLSPGGECGKDRDFMAALAPNEGFIDIFAYLYSV